MYKAFLNLLITCLTLAPAYAQAPAAPEPPTPQLSAEPKPAPAAPLPVYSVTFDVTIIPSEKSADVQIHLGPGASVVKWLKLRTDPLRHQGFEADGELLEIPSGWQWRPPPGGGSIRYKFAIDHLRGESYDARMAMRWAIFRGDDLVPQIRIRTEPVARSNSRLRLQLPEGWTAVLPYKRELDGAYSVVDRGRRFDRPAGWFAVGELGVLRERVAGTRVSIAGPTGDGVRRMDLLAMLRWTLPTLSELFERLPDRLSVVSAGDPMWRGGLSGTNSVYLHADRPLISESGSSPLLHELVHTLMRARAGRGGDWIVEGLAELYSIEVLRRSGTLDEERFEAMIAEIEQRAKRAGKLRVAAVSSDTRARAVVVLREIDAGIRSATDQRRSLDDVIRSLAKTGRPVTTSSFRSICDEVAGAPLDAIFDRYVPPIVKSGKPKAAR